MANPEHRSRKSEALIGLGTNLGDREGHLVRAWELLGQVTGVCTLRLSRFYETRAVTLSPDLVQPDYLNAVGLLETELDPHDLYHAMSGIERLLGRVRTERWGPRTIDLDLLLYGDIELHTELLTIPHPRMTERKFVLEPAAEIAPNMQHPTSGKTITQLLSELSH